ncbi:MAG: tetratricopeptide repeat protein [Heliobacteriaceae bacterium]|jgi:tetratricopeptide (TPR) repeat protein|nr:tetratricopeptide repeat protein [Heliobacteriaceae bacterium]
MTKQLEKKINKEYRTGNVKNAIELCQIGLQDDPTNADLHVRLGDLFLAWHLDIYNSCQYIDEAITEYQRALETYIDSAEIYFKIGQAQYYKGDLDKAVNYFDMAISKNPMLSKAYYLLAETYTKKVRFLEASLNAKKAIQTAPFRNSRAHYLLSNLYKVSSFRSLKNFFMSKWEYFLSVLTLPLDKHALENVCKMISNLRFFPILLRGFYLVQTRGLHDAIGTYIEAVEKAPGFVPLYCLLGDIYRSIGQFDDAITEYKMAVWLDSLNVNAYRHLCQAYEEQGDYDNAVEIYLKLIQIMPNMPDVHSNLANILYVKGDIPGAISHFQTAVTLNPKKQWTSVINQTLGFVYQEAKNDLDAAISSYQSAYLLTPEDLDIYVNLGSAFYDKDDVDNALAIYRNALDLDPHNAKIHCNLGFLFWGKGDIEQAIKEYNLAIEYDPSYDVAYNNLGVIYLDDLGRVKQAVELFKKSIESNPGYALAHFNLARSIAITGDKIEAAKLYQVAQEINRVTGEIDPEEILEKINGLFN